MMSLLSVWFTARPKFSGSDGDKKKKKGWGWNKGERDSSAGASVPLVFPFCLPHFIPTQHVNFTALCVSFRDMAVCQGKALLKGVLWMYILLTISDYLYPGRYL